MLHVCAVCHIDPLETDELRSATEFLSLSQAHSSPPINLMMTSKRTRKKRKQVEEFFRHLERERELEYDSSSSSFHSFLV
jgi:hypothetical protein